MDKLQVEYVKLSIIKGWPKNPKNHDIEAIDTSIDEFGFRDPVAINLRTGEIEEGHGRIQTLLKRQSEGKTPPKFILEKENDWWIPVVYFDDDELTQYRYAIAHNRTTELGGWDYPALIEDLNYIHENSTLEGTGYNFDDLNKLALEYDINLGTDYSDKDADAVPEVPEIPKTKRGDIYELPAACGGWHRVMCGDSTDNINVEKLMNKEKIDLFFTSPPYNSGNGGYKTDYYGKTKKFYKQKTDDKTETEWIDFCGIILKNIVKFLKDDETPVVINVMYNSNCRNGYGKLLFCYDHGLSVKETICWDKGSGFPSATKGILSRNWELIFVMSIGIKYKTTQLQNEVRWAKWKISRPLSQQKENNASFPIELPLKVIQDFCIGNTISDLFLGSGTSLIAAEKTNRRCYGMEIDEHYCDIIVQRYCDFTGNNKIKLNGQDIEWNR